MSKYIAIIAALILFIGVVVWLQSATESSLTVEDSAATSTSTDSNQSTTEHVGTSTQPVSTTSTQTGGVPVSSTTASQTSTQKIMKATFKTSMGDIVIEFSRDATPKTVDNFVTLAQSGFYNGTKFHRVIKGFMNQGGDPLSKDDTLMARWGTGGPGYMFADEITKTNNNAVGTIAMANAGPNTNGSQFFINVADNSFLNDKHTVFGKVITGMDVVTKINEVDTVKPTDRPIDPIVIKEIILQ